MDEKEKAAIVRGYALLVDEYVHALRHLSDAHHTAKTAREDGPRVGVTWSLIGVIVFSQAMVLVVLIRILLILKGL